jgi:hypothetical protein
VPTQAVPVVDEPGPASASADEPTTTAMAGLAEDRDGDDEPTVLAASSSTADEPTALIGTASPGVGEAGGEQEDEEPTAPTSADGETAPLATAPVVAAPDQAADDAGVPTERSSGTPASSVGPPTTPYDSKPADGEDEDTAHVGAESPAEPADEPTEANTVEVDAATADVEEPMHEAGDEPTEARTRPDDDEPTEVQAASAVEDEPTEVVTAAANDDEPAEVSTSEPVMTSADDGDERTQVLRLPVAPMEADPDEPTRPLERGDRTRTAGPGETTQVIFWREPVNQPTPEDVARAQAAADQTARDRSAQERARQAFRDRAAQERAKEAFAERAAQDAREHGEQTQVINFAALRGQPIPGDQTQVLPGAGRTPPAGDRTRSRPDAEKTETEPDGDQTQVIRGMGQPVGDRTQVLPRGSTVEPPGDRTQVLSIPVPKQIPGERTTDKQEAATRASSIAGAEQPDPGADPTTRLTPARPAGQDTGEGTGEGTTADVGDNRRTKGVLDLERPADETADDTRRLVLPTQRRPEDDEPTTRL